MIERRAFLASAVLCVGILLGLVWLAGRRAGGEIGLPSSATADDSALREEHVSRLEDPPSSERVALAATASRSAPPAEEPPAPALVGGRLTVDGLPVVEGWARLQTEDGSWASRSALDGEGRFSFGGVPIAALSLIFELPPPAPSDPRALLLPSVPVSPRAGEAAQLDLDWTTQQVNVRVLDAGMSGIPGRVSVMGPGHDSCVETAEDGTVELALVGEGRFSFDAEVLGRRQARTEIELDPSSGLVSVVIVVRGDRGP